MGNTRHALFKPTLHIFTENSHSKLPSHTHKKVFLDSNLIFIIRVFTWGLENDHDIWKKYEKSVKCFINNKINLK